MVSGFGVLAMDAANLDLEAVSNGFKLLLSLSKVG